MAYRPHLRHVADGLDRLWETDDLARLFPGAQAKATLPWARAARLPNGDLFDREAVLVEFANELQC